MILTPEQIRAATALLGMTQKSLSEATGITRANLNKFDKRESTFRADSMARVFNFFDNNNIHFTQHNGAEFKPTENILKLHGPHGFVTFMDDVHDEVKEKGGQICVSNVNERHWIKWMGEERYKQHSEKMSALSNYFFKIFIEDGDDFFIANKFAEYKHIPSEFFNDQSFYAYGDKLALIAFEEQEVRINIVKSAGWTQGFRRLFNFAWENTPHIKK